MAIYIYFVTAPYAAPGVKMAMLFFYSGLVPYIGVSGFFIHAAYQESRDFLPYAATHQFLKQ
jgi:hypothetical protein